MESEADRTAAPAAPAVAAETSDDAIQEESLTTAPSSDGKPGSGAAAATSAPEVEVQLFRRRGRPVAVFRSQLGGYTQDQLEVGDILEQHGLKSVFAFDPAARKRGVTIRFTFDPAARKRGVTIRFNPRNGRSLLTYAPGSTIFLDGEPKDSTWRIRRYGFCGMRSKKFDGFIDLDAYDTIAMKIKGDGRCYISTIYTENWVNSPGQQEDNSWQAFVYIPLDRWQLLKIPLDRYLPTWRGNVIEAKLEMNPARIVGMALSVAKTGPGDFRLEVDWIKALRTL